MLTVLGFIAITAVVHFTELDIWIRLPAGLCVLFLVLKQLGQIRHRRCLLTHNTDGSWSLQTLPSRSSLTGQLVRLGYRSAHLLILTLQTEEGRLHRLPIWCDQLNGREFSYLQQQVAFAAEAPAPRDIRCRLFKTERHETPGVD